MRTKKKAGSLPPAFDLRDVALELGDDTGVEGPAADVVHAASGADAAQAQRRLLVGEVVDAEVEIVLRADIDAEPGVDVEHLRIVAPVGIVGILRRTALVAVRILIGVEDLLPEVAHGAADGDVAGLDVGVERGLVLRQAGREQDLVGEVRIRRRRVVFTSQQMRPVEARPDPADPLDRAVVADLEVDAARAQLREVDRRLDEAALDDPELLFAVRARSAGGDALEELAELVVERGQIVALVEDELRAHRRDHVVHADVVIIDRDRKPRDEPRLQHAAERPRVRSLRREERVAAAADEQRGAVAEVVARGNSGRLAIRGTVGRAGTDVNGRARIPDGCEVLAERAVQLAEVRSADGARVVRTEAKVLDRRPVDTVIVGVDLLAHALVLGHAARAAQRQLVEERHVLQDRDPDFAIGFLHGERGRCELRDGVVEGVAGLDERVLAEQVRLAPILGADGEGDRAARKAEPAPGVARDEAVGVELGDLAVRGGVGQQVIALRLGEVAAERIDRDAGRNVGREPAWVVDAVEAPGRRRVELRAADDLAGGRVDGGIVRKQEAVGVQVAQDLGRFLELAVVRRDFIGPVAEELAAQTGDGAIRLALRLLVADAEAEQVFTQREAGGAGRGDTVRDGELLGNDRPRLRTEERVVEAVLLAIVAAEDGEGRALDEGRTRRAGTERVRAGVFGLDERHQRVADIEVGDEVDVVAVKLREQLELSLVAEAVAVAADEAAGRTDGDPGSRLGNEVAAAVEDEVAEIRAAERVRAAILTGRDLTRLGRRRAAEADQAAVGEARRADILEEEAVRSAVAAVRRAGRVGIDDEEVVVVQQIGTGVGENRRLVRELAVD